MRHLEARDIHLQATVSARMIEIMHIKELDNPADILTKFVDYATLEKNLHVFGLVDIFKKIVATIQRKPALQWKAPVFVGAVLMQVPVVDAMPDGESGMVLGLFEYVLLTWSLACFIAGFWLRGKFSSSTSTLAPQPVGATTSNVGTNTDVVDEARPPPAASSAAAAAAGEKVFFSTKSNVAHLRRECGHLLNCEHVLSYAVCKDCQRASARLTRR